MLNSLHVKNFAIIDEVWLDFGQGFNVMSGETGAGKSILIGSVLAALGGKFSKEMLGSRGDYALVELEFSMDSEELRQIFADNDLEFSDQIIVSRKISENGRSVCRINGETVSAAILKQVASKLIDVFGQHEHHSLLSKPAHKRIVDSFSDEIGQLLPEVSKAYRAYVEAEKAYEEALSLGKLSDRELDLLKYELSEIEGAKLKVGEDDDLEERYKILGNAEKLKESISAALSELDEGYNSADSKINDATKALAKIASLDDNINSIFSDLELISDQLSGVISGLRDYEEELTGSDEEYYEIGQRLDVYNKLKAKFGGSVEAVLDYYKELSDRIEKNDDYELYLGQLEKAKETKKQELLVKCEKLSKLRVKTGKELSEKISKAMEELNFSKSEFEVKITKKDQADELGIDDVEFYVSTNIGEPTRSILTCASGGELSRIMLAIKSVIADKGSVDTLIFDEIDVGISGRTAQCVAEKIAKLSRKAQIICITHLPQLAAMADTHFLIEKKEEDGKTVTGLTKLGDEEIVGELARMLSGAEVTKNVLENAREMKALASGLKTQKY